MKRADVPFTRTYDLGDLGRAGDTVAINLKEADRKRLAAWAEVESVTSFQATVDLTRISANRFGYRAHLTSDVIQSCVVTLEPVRSHIVRDFSRELHLADNRHHETRTEALTLAAAEDEAPEEIESLDYDLAGPLLEELSLAIDPYPRAPGVTFESPPDETRSAEGPFAALKSLKERD